MAFSIDGLKSCIATLETSMFAAHDILKNLEERVDGLEGEYADFSVATKALI